MKRADIREAKDAYRSKVLARFERAGIPTWLARNMADALSGGYAVIWAIHRAIP